MMSSSVPICKIVEEGDSADPATAAGDHVGFSTAANVAYNYKWILACGIFNVIGGLLCLLAPITATLAAEAIVSWTLILLGLFSLSGLCFAEKRLKPYFTCFGVIQMVLGVVFLTHPYETLTVYTLFVAIMVLLDGIYQTTTSCFFKRELPGWGLVLASGLASIVLAVMVLTGLPESSLYTIGILLGVDFIMIGNMRIHVATESRRAANRYG